MPADEGRAPQIKRPIDALSAIRIRCVSPVSASHAMSCRAAQRLQARKASDFVASAQSANLAT